MQKRHFDMETDGFYGVYWKCKTDADCAMIAMIGDDSEDYLARTSVKWLHKLGVNVMTMSPAKKNYGHHNYPLERIEKAISWLKTHGNQKIGIVGASTTGTLALTAASYFEDLTLTIGLTPSDFIWQGFMQGKKDGCKEWPIEGESLFSYKGEPLPYMPFVYFFCISSQAVCLLRNFIFFSRSLTKNKVICAYIGLKLLLKHLRNIICLPGLSFSSSPLSVSLSKSTRRQCSF